jgi:hypothetical protein
MNAPVKAILLALALLIGAWLGYAALDRWYLLPRREALNEIADINLALASQAESRRLRPEVARELDQFVDRTLGGKLETVDHRLRTRLNRLAEQVKLQGVSVGTEGGGTARQSPARSVFRAASQRGMREEVDFVEVQAWISGNGSLEDVVRLIADIQAEPWIKRIDSVGLVPRENGSRLAVNLRLTTLFLPGREPRTEVTAGAAGVSIDRYAALVSGNPFRVPPAPQAAPPAAAAAAAAQPAPPPAPLFPWNEWTLTGVAQGPAGAEAWLLHKPTGQTRVLSVGQSLDAAALSGVQIDSQGDAAEFTLGDQRFRIAVGATMDQRAPAAQ